jgi:hypothetical protein
MKPQSRPDQLIKPKPEEPETPQDTPETDAEATTAEESKKDPLISMKGSDGRIITSEDVEKGLKNAGGQIVEAMSEPFQEAVNEVVSTAKNAAEAFLNGFTNRKKPPPEPDLQGTKEDTGE